MASASRNWILGCGVLFVVLLMLSGLALLFASMQMSGDRLGLPRPGPKVGVVEVAGVLGDDDDVLEQLERLKEDGSIRALVLHVNCPGGAVGTTQRIIARIEGFKEEGLPVIAALDDVAASGGYYVATAADSIFALPGTLTGSIGVIMSFPDFSGLMEKLGVDNQVVKAGPYKDAGSPFRPLTPEERGWMTDVLADVHEQFIAAVIAGRPAMPADSVRAWADGRFFSGRQAYRAGLVDRLTDLDEAVRVAGEMAGIKGEPVIVRKHKETPAWQKWLEQRLPAGLPFAGRWPRLEYRWR